MDGDHIAWAFGLEHLPEEAAAGEVGRIAGYV